MHFNLVTLIFQLFAALILADEDTRPRREQVLYSLDNDPAGNYLLSFLISNKNGTLSSGVRTSTGGYGLALLNVSPPDSVHVAGNYLFVSNAGSNTVSMFSIDPSDPLHPRVIGKPTPSLGQNPTSIAYSPKLNTACVQNGGGGVVGVTCFYVDPVRGLIPNGPMRAIQQPSNAGPVPPGVPPVFLIADIAFNPSSTAVFITFSNSTTNGAGYIYAYPVIDGQVGRVPVVSTLADITVPYSFNFLGSDDRAFVTNPHLQSAGAGLLDISHSLQATEAKIVTIPGQVASCWIGYAPEYDRIFVMDAIVPNITFVDADNGDTLSQLPFQTPSFGASDTMVYGQFLYHLTLPFSNDLSVYIAHPQVHVYEISPLGKGQIPVLIQSYDIFNATGSSYEVVGLGIWPSRR